MERSIYSYDLVTPGVGPLGGSTRYRTATTSYQIQAA